MKKSIAAVFLIALASSAFAQVHVNGYMKSNGTYVQPHMRSSPNSTTLDNYSTKGNVNPYTGQAGTKNPDPQDYYAQPVQQQRQAQPVQQIQPLQPLQPLQPIQPLQPMQTHMNSSSQF
jgi:hypothetical protein